MFLPKISLQNYMEVFIMNIEEFNKMFNQSNDKQLGGLVLQNFKIKQEVEEYIEMLEDGTSSSTMRRIYSSSNIQEMEEYIAKNNIEVKRV